MRSPGNTAMTDISPKKKQSFVIVDYRDEEDLIRVMIALGIVVYKMIFKSYPELPIMDRSIQC